MAESMKLRRYKYWTKAKLIEEVERLRKINRSQLETIMKVQGIKGSVTTEEIDNALKNNLKNINTNTKYLYN